MANIAGVVGYFRRFLFSCGSRRHYEGPTISSLHMHMLGETFIRLVRLACTGNVGIDDLSPLDRLCALGFTGVDVGEYSAVLLSGDLWAM